MYANATAAHHSVEYIIGYQGIDSITLKKYKKIMWFNMKLNNMKHWFTNIYTHSCTEYDGYAGGHQVMDSVAIMRKLCVSGNMNLLAFIIQNHIHTRSDTQ